jgi:hypothetical protein
MRDTIRKSSNRYSQRPVKSLSRRQSAAQMRMAATRLQAADALKNNRCPTCSATVRQNLALTGWVQCSQFGAPEFRMNPNRPACDWQGFTE